MTRMFRVGISRVRLSKCLFNAEESRRVYCTSTTRSIRNGKTDGISSPESDASTYPDSYRELHNMDFATASKILFAQPRKKKKFGIDFHLVQFFFACLPSLAVYLVAKYARSEMRRMDAELEQKQKQEEEKAREKEREKEQSIITKIEGKTHSELLDIKVRIDKLEGAVKEVVAGSKKQSAGSVNQSIQDGNGKRDMNKKDEPYPQEDERERSLKHSAVKVSESISSASAETQKDKSNGGVPSQDAKA